MRVGVLLGGCGHYDGTDVSEAVFVLLALEKAGERPVLLAPDVPQVRTVDHRAGDRIEGEQRGVLGESARIARQPVRSLAECRPEDLEAIIIPGGYGPVVNFSVGFAEPGAKRTIVSEVAEYIAHFIESRKPIGLVSLGEVPLRTLLNQEMVGTPETRDSGTLFIDRERRIVFTPGCGSFTRLEDIRTGIEAMVREILKMMGEARGAEGAP